MTLYALLFRTDNSKGMDAETVFSTIAVLSMVTHPANMVMTIVPQAIACFASFERLQTYLVDSTRRDNRTMLAGSVSTSSISTVAAKFTNATTAVVRGDTPILQSIDLEIKRRDFVFCAGPVGSGKSVLAKAVLGEVPMAQGTVQVSFREMGFCAQTAWLPGGTLQEAVCGPGSVGQIDEHRYKEAIRLVCLDHDIATFPQGDATSVGSRGSNLSGGQRQRFVSP